MKNSILIIAAIFLTLTSQAQEEQIKKELLDTFGESFKVSALTITKNIEECAAIMPTIPMSAEKDSLEESYEKTILFLLGKLFLVEDIYNETGFETMSLNSLKCVSADSLISLILEVEVPLQLAKEVSVRQLIEIQNYKAITLLDSVNWENYPSDINIFPLKIK